MGDTEPRVWATLSWLAMHHCSVKWIGLHRRNPWDPGRISIAGLDSLEVTKSGISRGGKLDNLGRGISCSLGVRILLTLVFQERRPAGMRTPLCRSLWASQHLSSTPSLPSFYQLPAHLSGAPASLTDWEHSSQPAIHPPSTCIY